jgi:methylenetetrahydrofolate dehydrogenase (NADP+)/methenyltetrahydrofolate cyclohydrolase
VASKHKKAQEAGMISVGVHLEDDATQEQVEAEVRKLAADPTVHGILVQLPLPKHLDAEPVLALLPPEKDVDGLTERSMGRLLRGLPGHAPCTPLGVMRLLERYEIPTKGKRVVVIGRSTLTGLPQLVLFLRKGGDATTTCTHSHTSPEDLKAYCREADIIVSCVGIARLITADHVKPGATVIDVGVSRIEAKIVGDVDFDSVQAVAGAITPMPGGTGPMTIGCLLENTLSAAKMLGAFPSK